MQRPSRIVLASTAIACAVAAPHAVSAEFIVDFEFDDNGAALGNGQIIDDEFFTRFSISSPETNVSHLGPTIFDSTSDGPNADGGDRDLLVDLGNILILQNTAYSSNDGFFFDVPNDEADYNPLDYGTIVFEFRSPVELVSLDLIDIDCGASVEVTLTDVSGLTRTYYVPQNWTYDISKAPSQMGYATLDLGTLASQHGERCWVRATACETPGFDPAGVDRLEIKHSGSAGIDNLVFVPGPSALLVMLAGLAVGRRQRR